MKPYTSWGRYPRSSAAQIIRLSWASEVPNLNCLSGPALAYGKGRSYGDCCLNDGGTLFDCSGLDRFILFDKSAGILRCEAGVTLQAISRLILPANWFLPVTPGTQFVTVGGAIANDVHGKNHHRSGSFGCHVLRFELLRSDRGRVLCSRETNLDLFQATIGGLGLTGLILWAEIQLKPVLGPWIDCEQIRFAGLDEFVELSESSDEKYEYTVSWLDCLSTGKKLGRGIFIRGNHSPRSTEKAPGRRGDRSYPSFDAPEMLISRPTIRMFNWIYFHRQWRDLARKSVQFDSFFYPLDRLRDWNRLYGRRGFLQYQFVVPYEKKESIREILEMIGASGEVCSLSVLKIFGAIKSPGLLSFPRPGVTLALDFPFEGSSTLDLCERFDEIVKNAGGAVYPAKDARMSAGSFKTYFPHWKEFATLTDPKCSSDFWRRVTLTDRGNR